VARDAEGFFEEVLGSSVFINQAPSLWGLERDYQTGITTALLGAQRTTGDESPSFLASTRRRSASTYRGRQITCRCCSRPRSDRKRGTRSSAFEQGSRKVHIASEMSRPAYARFINHALRLGLMRTQGGLYSKNQA